VEQDEKCLAAILCFLSSQAANVTTKEEISNIIIGMFLPSNRNESEDTRQVCQIMREVEQYPFVITCSLCRMYQRQNATTPGTQKEINHVA
jgi:hypothetical protein